MPRLARIAAVGERLHITQRVNNQQDVFFVEDDRRVYLRFLRDYAQPIFKPLWDRYATGKESISDLVNSGHIRSFFIYCVYRPWRLPGFLGI